ncbi:MAG TPA: glycosyltransferase [Candidatus Acidoferrales bacterium]|nr:glycosyltransferase [Candidatus Acidoferrales bacterium]
MPEISAIVPARNEEANIEACVTSLAAQPEIAEIIIVNDASTDRTGEILRGLSKTQPQLKVLDADTLPDGWLGKNFAAWSGAQAACSEWLLFTDADTVLLLGAAHRALIDVRAHDAALVSYSPEQITKTFAERALIPFIYCRLSRKFSFARVNNPSLADAAANGQFLLIRRDAYEQIGGHRSVASSVLEDVALAHRIKQAGLHLYFATGKGIARTRMYRGLRPMWEGWTKNLYLLLGGTRSAILQEFLKIVPWLAVALIGTGLLLSGELGRWLVVIGFTDLLVRHALYSRELTANRYSLWFILYYVPAVILYAVAMGASSCKYNRGEVTWKGRKYLVKEP